MTAPRNPNSAVFHELLTRIADLHDRKAADYGTDGDPFANVRSAQEWGVSPVMGAFIRIGDKIARLKTFALKGELQNESVEDACMDLAVYALIALILLREEAKGTVETAPVAGRIIHGTRDGEREHADTPLARAACGLCRGDS